MDIEKTIDFIISREILTSSTIVAVGRLATIMPSKVYDYPRKI
ncbi:hypothetical protein ACLIBH_01005 [Virgibacillus sp. W0430]